MRGRSTVCEAIVAVASAAGITDWLVRLATNGDDALCSHGGGRQWRRLRVQGKGSIPVDSQNFLLLHFNIKKILLFQSSGIIHLAVIDLFVSSFCLYICLKCGADFPSASISYSSSCSGNSLSLQIILHLNSAEFVKLGIILHL